MAKRRSLILLVLLLFFVTPSTVLAHVKWFTDFSFADPPNSLDEVITPTFIGLALFTTAALGLAVVIERLLGQTGWWRGIVQWFEERREYAPLALRIGLGMTLILSWQAETLLQPDLPVPHPVVGWIEFLLALLLIFPRTVPLAGAGTLGLYGLAVVEFGGFYMLDYFIFVGVAIYLMVFNLENPRWRGLRIPALYFSVGFSLLWVALEKLVYPQWGLAILSDNPVLTLGFEPEFFLVGAAFVELALGYLFVIGLLERPIALLVTLVFFGTTMVFGKVEVIGHTIIHAALVVFLLEGTARTYPAPVNIHRRLGRRIAFASVNFLLILGILLVPYAIIAQTQYESAVAMLRSLLPIL
ncbi:MAG: hypothetical protein ACOCYT_05830 [Chloroflexota bacterium]